MTSDAERDAAREDHDLHSQTSVKQAALPEQPSSSILARSLRRTESNQRQRRDDNGEWRRGRGRTRPTRERGNGGRNHVHAMQDMTARVNRTFRLLRQVETY